MLKVKVYKNSSFIDQRGYYWTSWEKGLIKNLEFKHDKFSLRRNDPKLNIKWSLQREKKMDKLKLSYNYSKPILSGRDRKS